jgi:hypothetical protein
MFTVKPMDLTAPAEYVYEVVGCSHPGCLFHGGLLNLLGFRDGRQRPCSSHPAHNIGPDGCPRCHEIRRYRLAFFGPYAADQLFGHAYLVGEGWHPILARLHEQVVMLVPDYTVGQLKEKFGGLRVHLDIDPNLDKILPLETIQRIWDLCEAAEGESERTCEYCGKPGVPTGAGWVKTLCTECGGRP